jgi:hypothetical protein
MVSSGNAARFSAQAAACEYEISLEFEHSNGKKDAESNNIFAYGKVEADESGSAGEDGEGDNGAVSDKTVMAISVSLLLPPLSPASQHASTQQPQHSMAVRSRHAMHTMRRAMHAIAQSRRATMTMELETLFQERIEYLHGGVRKYRTNNELELYQVKRGKSLVKFDQT